MARWKRFRSGPRGTLVVSLAEEELALLRGLPEQLRDVLEGPGEDPARARIFPARTSIRRPKRRSRSGRSWCTPSCCANGSTRSR